MVSELLSRHVLLNHDKLAQGVTEISLVEDDLQVPPLKPVGTCSLASIALQVRRATLH